MHTVDVGPDLDLFGTNGGTYQRSTVVATATEQVINLSVRIAADEALRNKEFCIGMFIQQLQQFLLDIDRIRFGILVRAHVIQSRNQHRLHATLVQIEVHHAC